MNRLGLCCAFREAPIRFRTTTAAAILRLPPARRLPRIAELIRHNARSLLAAVRFCADHGIGSFRVNSQILPLKTHPAVGYEVCRLPDSEEIIAAFRECGRAATSHDVRLTFHPDQFVVLSSPRPDVVTASLAEIEYQAEVAQWIGADVITIHGGGAYGDKPAAIARLAENLRRLSRRARQRVALENDDRIFSPADLLPMCESGGVPLVYDVHHHRCLPDTLTSDEVTRRAIATWDREPLFHVSSPSGGWQSRNPRVHADLINLRDYPGEWQSLAITVEVEARAKEAAVLQLKLALSRRMRRASRRQIATAGT